MTVLFCSCVKLRLNSAVNAENFAGTTRPSSLFLFPVTRAQSLFYCFLVKKLPCEVRYLGLNKVIFEETPQLDREK